MPTSVIVAIGSSVIGQAIGTWIGNALIGKIIGAVIGAVLTSALSRHKQDDAPSFSIAQQDRTVTVRQAVSPWQVIYGDTRVGGTHTHIESTRSGTSDDLHIVITFAGHVSDSIVAIYFDDELVELDDNGNAVGRYAGYVYIHKSLGDDVGQPFPELVLASAGGWTDSHRQTGRTKIYCRLTYSPDVFPNGVPNITARIKGKKVYDPRSGLTQWSDNPALCIADYLRDVTYGMGHGLTEIDTDALAAAANICDEAITLASGATEKRYTLNGPLATNVPPKDAIPRMLAAMHGTAVWIGGVWEIHAGAYVVPTVTFSEGDFAGPIRVQTRLSRRDNFNAVKGIFTSPADLWQPIDFPPITSSAYEAEDNSERVWQDVELSFTDSPTMAQRIAKVQLRRARQPITVSGRLKLSAYRVAPPRTVMLTLARFGWVDKPFEVIESTLAIADDAQGAPVLVVDMVFRETASSVYDWSASEEQALDPAPNTNLPNPFVAAAPGPISVTESVYVTRDRTGVKARATVSWGAAADAYVVSYQLEYRLHGEDAYTVLPLTASTRAEINDIAPGDYDFRVKSINAIGVSSAYTAQRAQIYGLASPPAALTGLTIQTAGGLAVLQWQQTTDADVLIGGRIDMRHSNSVSGGSAWAEASPIGSSLPGASTLAIVPLKSGTYFVRPYDSSGVAAPSATSVSTDGATALAFVSVDTLVEDPTFSGTKTLTIVDGGVLKLDGIGDFDSQPDVDAIIEWDAIGGIASAGSYDFAATMDLGSVKRVRITSRLDVTVVAVLDDFDSRAGEIDDWPSFDGTDGDEADATVEVRTTSDDPSGAPTWSTWRRLDASEAVGRGFQFRAQLVSHDSDFNIEVSALRVDADEVA